MAITERELQISNKSYTNKDFEAVYTELLTYAEKLSKKFPFVRADFYLEDGKVIFGELTFTPSGGFDLDITAKTELFLGEKLKL